MIFNKQTVYHWIENASNYSWRSKTFHIPSKENGEEKSSSVAREVMEEDSSNNYLPVTWPKIAQISPTEWLCVMGMADNNNNMLQFRMDGSNNVWKIDTAKD